MERRIVFLSSTNGGFQKMKVFFPLGEPSVEIISNSFPVSFFACSFGFAMVADDSMICGSAL